MRLAGRAGALADPSSQGSRGDHRQRSAKRLRATGPGSTLAQHSPFSHHAKIIAAPKSAKATIAAASGAFFSGFANGGQPHHGVSLLLAQDLPQRRIKENAPSLLSGSAPSRDPTRLTFVQRLQRWASKSGIARRCCCWLHARCMTVRWHHNTSRSLSNWRCVPMQRCSSSGARGVRGDQLVQGRQGFAGGACCCHLVCDRFRVDY